MDTKVMRNNILILLAYMVGLTALSGGDVLILSIGPIAIHVLVNFILFISHANQNTELSRTYLLSALIVLLIGFSSCWGLSTVAGGLRL